jgi:hypothetical protein
VARAGFKVDRFKNFELATLVDNFGDAGRPTHEEHYSVLQYRREAVLELVAQRLWPLFVRFCEAGFDQAMALWGLMPFESAKQVAMAYVRRGYVGDLFFKSDCYDNCGSYNPARCDLHLAPFTEHFRPALPLRKIKPFAQLVKELAEAQAAGDLTLARLLWDEQFPAKPSHPALIKLEWNDRYGGKEDDLASLISACQILGLKPLDPAPIGFGFSYMTY